MVNYYAVLDAFPQMTHLELLLSYENIQGHSHTSYGRHRVDEDLVSERPTLKHPSKPKALPRILMSK